MNKDLFRTNTKYDTDTTNRAGGKAYTRDAKQALAQYVMTGVLQNTFYSSAKDQLDTVLNLAKQVDDQFLAKLAVKGRQEGYMKDMPAVLLAVLVTRNITLADVVFDKVIDNGKMLKNFVQVMRSGVVGRKSLGSASKRMVKNWIANKTASYIFKNSIGNDPSMADVIKMVHPKPTDKEKQALFAYLIGKNHNANELPQVVQQFEAFKKDPVNVEVPKISFQFLSSHLSDEQWKDIAKNCSWTQARMNLNTFSRHGVFNDSDMTKLVASKLSDSDLVKKAKVFPYQIMTAYRNIGASVPSKVANALQDAMDTATENVPAFDGEVVVCNDISYSMSSPISQKSKVRYTDVAGLFASVLLKSNPDARTISFNNSAHEIKLNARDSVMTNAKILGKTNGGTNCAAPLELLNRENAKADCVVIVSDNESWRGFVGGGWHGTGVAEQWKKFRKRNPKAKLVLIDIEAGSTTQLADDANVLNVGGFSDQVFNVINSFMRGEGHWVSQIESLDITK